MIEIPKQLSFLKFCRVKKGTKKPFEKEWTKKPYSYKEISKFLPEENYGVLCGYENLAVIDCDNKILQDTIEKKLPKTFSVKTGGGGMHFYFYIPELKEKIIVFNENIHLGEVQSYGQQVIGPESIHPNNKKYSTINKIEIQKITLKHLQETLKIFNSRFDKIQRNFTIEKTEYKGIDSLNISEIWDLTNLTQRGDEYYGEHPIHGSTTGANFWVNTNKNIWSCFRCKSGGGPLSAIAVKEGLIECPEAEKGILKSDIGFKIIEIAIKKYNLNQEIAEKIKYIISKTIELEKKIYEISERDLRRSIDLILKEISDLENWADIKYLLGLIAKKIKISRKELEKRIEFIKAQSSIKIHTFSAIELFKMELPEIDCFVKNFIPKNSLIQIQGKPGHGKSIFTLELCCSMLSKKTFLGFFEILETPKILYYDLENEIYTISKRLKYIIKGEDYKPEEIFNNNFTIEKHFNQLNLTEELEKCKNFDIIILDSLRRFLDGDENKSEVTNKFFNNFTKKLLDLGKTIIQLHHEVKGKRDESNNYEGAGMERGRGSGDIGAQLDLCIILNKIGEMKKINSKTLLIDFNIEIDKNRKGIDIDKYHNIRIEKNDDLETTNIFYLGSNRPPKPSERIINQILDFIEEKKTTTLKEILDYSLKLSNFSSIYIQKLLSNMVNEELIEREKNGVYSVSRGKQEKNSLL